MRPLLLIAIVCSALCLLAPGIAHAAGEGRAEQSSGTAYWGVGRDMGSNLFETVRGSVDLDVTDRVQRSDAPFGDRARLSMEVLRGADVYRVELVEAGFRPGTIGVPSVPLAGGVILDTQVYGPTGQGPVVMTPAPAAITVWGRARVWRNGQRVTENARLQAAALTAGIHADDGSYRMLGAARPGDNELTVIVDRLPTAVDPRGFLVVGFDDVRIERDGVTLPAQLLVDSVTGDALQGAPAAGPGPATYGYGGALLAGTLAVPAASAAPVGTATTTPGTLAGAPGALTVNPADILTAAGTTLAASSDATSTAGAVTAATDTATAALGPGTGGSGAAGDVAQNPAAIVTAATSAAAVSPPEATPTDIPATAEVLGPSSVVAGIPASPPVGNNGQAVTPLPNTPTPLNAQIATPLISTPAPLNSLPASALPGTPAPANAAAATPIGVAPVGPAVGPVLR